MKPIIIYEDPHIMIIDKPSGILSHRAKHLNEPDILSELSTKGYALISRLDYNTSGLLLLGKTPQSVSLLNRLSQSGGIRKFYECIVIGYLMQPEALLEAYLIKDPRKATVQIAQTPYQGSQKIRTHYKVIAESGGLSHLEIELITGKTHQIRAHLASIGHPILGDPLYGNPQTNKKYQLRTQQLVASRIEFSVPQTDHPLHGLHQKVFRKPDAIDISLLKR
jgi:23S rRNA pseudouridine955/2504/2580 synthase